MKTSMLESGEITIEINYLYTKEQIEKIDNEVNKIINEKITSEMSEYEKIKTIHDFIINTTKYDVERNKNGDSKYLSYIAYGPLFDHMATCNGYTDLMAIFLTKFNIKN